MAIMVIDTSYFYLRKGFKYRYLLGSIFTGPTDPYCRKVAGPRLLSRVFDPRTLLISNTAANNCNGTNFIIDVTGFDNILKLYVQVVVLCPDRLGKRISIEYLYALVPQTSTTICFMSLSLMAFVGSHCCHPLCIVVGIGWIPLLPPIVMVQTSYI